MANDKTIFECDTCGRKYPKADHPNNPTCNKCFKDAPCSIAKKCDTCDSYLSYGEEGKCSDCEPLVAACDEIIIVVEGGIVQEVIGLPNGWHYRLIDHD